MKTFFVSMGFLIGLSLGCGSKQHDGSVPEKQAFLSAGADVPALVRVDHRGKVVSLRSDTPTLVYFYPRDGTPGCTKEACAFRDSWQKYETAGVRVIGVSSDSEDDHRKFAEEHSLPFSLIADPEHVWSDAFGVGTFAGLDSRVSFLIDAHGKVAKSYDDVDPGVHAEQVLADAQQLGLTAKPAAVETPPEAPSATPPAQP
ncbi:MAG: peroxiredoxin [Myxococcales bacterium]